jgi:hypothetical protein
MTAWVITIEQLNRGTFPHFFLRVLRALRERRLWIRLVRGQADLIRSAFPKDVRPLLFPAFRAL